MSDLHPDSHQAPRAYLRSIGESIAQVLVSKDNRQPPEASPTGQWMAPHVRWDPDSLNEESRVRLDSADPPGFTEIENIVVDVEAASALAGRMGTTPAAVLDEVVRGFVDGMAEHVPPLAAEIVGQIRGTVRNIPQSSRRDSTILEELDRYLGEAIRPRAPQRRRAPREVATPPSTPSPGPTAAGERSNRREPPEPQGQPELPWLQRRRTTQSECARLRDSLNEIASKLAFRSIRGSSQHANIATQVVKILKDFEVGLDEIMTVDQFKSDPKGLAAAEATVHAIQAVVGTGEDSKRANIFRGSVKDTFDLVHAVGKESSTTVRTPLLVGEAVLNHLVAVDHLLPARAISGRGWV
jgi:hypothetical protein